MVASGCIGTYDLNNSDGLEDNLLPLPNSTLTRVDDRKQKQKITKTIT